MTAPNQPIPTWMELVGLGAFQVGGSGGGSGQGSFGQGVTSDAVTAVIQGPATALMNLNPTSALSDLSTLISGYLNTLPLQGLQMFKGFLPGTTAAQFADVPTAVTTIMNALGLDKNKSMSASAFASWLTTTYDDFAASGAAFWTWLQAVSTAITNYTTWSKLMTDLNTAWTTYQAAVTALEGAELASFETMLEKVFGINTTTGQNAQWASLMSQVTALQTLLASPPVSASAWASWWTTTLEDLGFDSTTATNTANFLSGNYKTAIDANAWSTRLTNDLLVLLDVFHITYTSTQWNAAWADLLALFGIVNSTSTPTNPAPTIGTSITAAQSSATTANTNASTAQSAATAAGTAASGAQTTANTGVANAATAQTTANNGNTNTGTFLGYTRVLADVFHLTYPAGSPSDTPTTTIGGLPTWYSAWNGMLQLEGLVKSTTAKTDTAPTTGTVIQANTAAATTAGTNASTAIASAGAANTLAQGTIDGLNSAWSSGGTGNPVSTVPTIAAAIPASAVVGSTPAAVTFGAVGTGNLGTGSATSKTISETHVPVTGDLGVLAVVSYLADVASTWTESVTYNGVAMTKVASTASTSNIGGAGAIFLEIWWLKTPAVGASATVTATITRASGAGNIQFLSVDTASYAGSKIGTVNAFSGGGSTSLSMSASSVANDMIFGAFAAFNASFTNALSAFSPTQRANQGSTFGVAFGDGTGSSSVAFSATNSHTATEWRGLTVQITN